MNHINKVLNESFQEAELTTKDGVHFDLVVKDPKLSSLTRLEAHRKVNEVLKLFIDSGELHAVSIKIIK